jgi:glycosyltransferase involved in cell wall biosynthesis
MSISVILAYYRNLTNLRLLLDAFEKQTFRDFELIIAEDDHNPETNDFLKSFRHRWSFPVSHVNQEFKKGFRKTMMLNRAIRISKGPLLVFIDGDCIPHRSFLKEYHKNSGVKNFLAGRRVLLGPKITERIRSTGIYRPLKFWTVLTSDSKRIKDALYWPHFRIHIKDRKLSGCNWGILKEDLEKINGFDEDFVRPGVGEDHDVEWRLKAIGATKVSMKNKAIVYHLHHEKNSTKEDERINESLMLDKIRIQQVVCKNGLSS